MRFLLLLPLLLAAPPADKEELRFRWTLEQGYDDSCGLQALACLFSVYWGIPAEEDGLAALLGLGAADPREVSLADLVLLAGVKGFEAGAFMVDFGELARLAVDYAPVLVHYRYPSGHFALVLAADGEKVVVSDPASGFGAMRRGDFESRWDGAIMLAAPRTGSETLRGPALASALAEVEARETLLRRVLRGGAPWRH